MKWTGEKKNTAVRISVCMLIAVLSTVIVGSTYAYMNSEVWTENEYQTGKYSQAIRENFEPPKDWLPGQDVNKDVTFENNGTVPVFVKVTLNQSWIRRENVYTSPSDAPIKPLAGEAFELVFKNENGEPEAAALLHYGKDVVLLEGGRSAKASLSTGLPVVKGASDAKGKWLLLSEEPDEKGNLTFYYIGVLEGGKTSPLLLDSVEMNPKINAAVVKETTVWDKTGKKWVTTYETNPTYDYQCARYSLNVKMETVQATKAAVEELFASDKTGEQSVISYIATLGKGVDYSRDDSVKEKKLTLQEKNGKLLWMPSTPTDNWFMSHLNMLPGESYTDSLTIRNQASKDYSIYMQIMPRANAKHEAQTELQDKLLKYIQMKIYRDGKLIYDGDVTGDGGSGRINDLNDKLYLLGILEEGESSVLKVELTLDKNTPLEYSDLLSRIDWKFKAVQEPSEKEEKDPEDPWNKKVPGGPVPPNTTGTTPKQSSVTPLSNWVPKTGDTRDTLSYAAVLLVCGLMLMGCVFYLIYDSRKRKH